MAPPAVVIPGRRVSAGPGIHNHSLGLWIPGSRLTARPGMTADGSMPAATALAPSTRSLPARGLACVDDAGAIRAHEAFDRGVQVVPWRVDEIVIAHSEGRTDEEFLVGRGAAGVVRADQVPGQLEQLHAIGGGKFAGAPIGLEHVAQLG